MIQSLLTKAISKIGILNLVKLIWKSAYPALKTQVERSENELDNTILEIVNDVIIGL